MSYRSLNVTFFLWLMTGCGVNMCDPIRSEMSPEDVVEAYLKTAFNMKKLDQRKHLLEYTTGGLKASLVAATDATIKALYLEKQYHVDNLYIASPQYKTPVECEVSYNLSYREDFDTGLPGKKSSQFEVKADSTVSLLKEDAGWSIQGVVGKRSQVAFPVVR